ncbi:hypothetical protein [Streptomyces viridochromogenes]|uniref:Uncharacterized protein n=1 Tax=Streptomyces viridochromogenes Tue57 TaxID=1160705 RepID=L8P3X6_STRVR|nr:hypothetical protein [Streptomyces viridochromogenes]ELS50889.1 hypothetical protein STVIR_8164 [Streptomyces viridochromogenes Tue57]
MPTSSTPGPDRRPRGGLPDGLPAPGPFAHLHPDDGACLMEAAALLATGRFTDSPPGTHPVLAALARAVNDSVSDHVRETLWPLAADLADAHPADRAYGPLLVGAVVDAARRVRPASRRLRRHSTACHQRARRIALALAPAPTTAARIADLLWWHGPGHHHLEHALRVLLTAPDADRLLSQLLYQAVAQARPAPSPAPGPADAPGRVHPPG